MDGLKCERMNVLAEMEWKAICDALWDAFYKPNKEEVRTVVDLALANPTEKQVWVARSSGVLGVLICHISEDNVVIDYIGTRREMRSHGIAKSLIRDLCTTHKNKNIFAETDDAAVDFYRHCDFDIELLPNKYPDVNRWRVIRKATEAV